MPNALRPDYDAALLRAVAGRSNNADQSRRLLALAAIYDGATRSEAAAIGGVTLQIVREWVRKLNEHGPDGLVDGKSSGRRSQLDNQHRAALVQAVEDGPIPALHGTIRWRLIDLCKWLLNEFGVSVSQQTLSRELKLLGYGKLPAKPRHNSQSAGATDASKELSPLAWMQSNPSLRHGRVPDTPSPLSESFVEVLARLPTDLDLDTIALATEAIKRKREVVSGAGLLRIALARGPGGLTLRQTAAWTSTQGIADLTDAAVKYRLDRAADFLASLSERLLIKKASATALCWPGRTLRIADSASPIKTKSVARHWRVRSVFDLDLGRFSDFQLTNKHGANEPEPAAPQRGEVQIGNPDFARACILKRARAQRDEMADFIVRVGPTTLQLAGQFGTLTDTLQSLQPGYGLHEFTMRASVGRDVAASAVRLILQRRLPEAAEATRVALQREEAEEGRTPSSCSLLGAEFTILATSLPDSRYLAADIVSAYQLHRQTKLAFKRLKSLLQMNHVPTESEGGSRTWLHAHLIFAVLSDGFS
jgi:transposase